MLVLSRKQKQQIKIGDNVVLTVLQVKGNSVRIGIEAPKSVHIIRGELKEETFDIQADESESFDISDSEQPGKIRAEESRSPNVIPSPQLANRPSDKKNEGGILEFRIHGAADTTREHRPSNRLTEIVQSLPATSSNPMLNSNPS